MQRVDFAAIHPCLIACSFHASFYPSYLQKSVLSSEIAAHIIALQYSLPRVVRLLSSLADLSVHTCTAIFSLEASMLVCQMQLMLSIAVRDKRD